MTEQHAFVTYLIQRLAGDRAALAALRRGLGQPPGSISEILPYVVPFVGDDPSWWYEKTIYTVASLFGLHPMHTGEGNMGDHLARLKSDKKPSLERRFTSLLAAHPEELDVHLRRTISILKADDVAINWYQLFQDILWWGSETRRDRVRRNWARSFWREPISGFASDKQEEGESE